MSSAQPLLRLDDLGRGLADLDRSRSAQEQLEQLIRSGLDRLPMPGQGATILRWKALAAVAATDLSLAKLYEGHTDALAIFAELDTQPLSVAAPASWGVWAAEAPQGRTHIDAGVSAEEGDVVQLDGAKCWCSGAAGASHALLTAWYRDGRGPQLVSVALRQPGVTVSDAAWRAVGMAGSASLDVTFDRAIARRVGKPGDYLSRPGFWQGGAGIAAVWYGGAVGIANALRASVMETPAKNRSPYRLAALGRVDIALRATAALLNESATWIDAHPDADASAVALRVRLCVEESATLTLAEVGRALGATPFCRDAHFARAAADLPVFMRQSHADRDLAALGERLLDAATTWELQ